MPADAVSYSFLDAFADAWDRHDTEAILSMMTPTASSRRAVVLT